MLEPRDYSEHWLYADKPPLTVDEYLEVVEHDVITLALERTAGNKSAAAKLLGIGRTTLLERIERLGVGQTSTGDIWERVMLERARLRARERQLGYFLEGR